MTGADDILSYNNSVYEAETNKNSLKKCDDKSPCSSKPVSRLPQMSNVILEKIPDKDRLDYLSDKNEKIITFVPYSVKSMPNDNYINIVNNLKNTNILPDVYMSAAYNPQKSKIQNNNTQDNAARPTAIKNIDNSDNTEDCTAYGEDFADKFAPHAWQGENDAEPSNLVSDACLGAGIKSFSPKTFKKIIRVADDAFTIYDVANRFVPNPQEN